MLVVLSYTYFTSKEALKVQFLYRDGTPTPGYLLYVRNTNVNVSIRILHVFSTLFFLKYD